MGMGTRVGTGGAIPGTTQLLEGGSITSEAGPVASCREAEWVGYGAGTPVQPIPPTPARAGLPGPASLSGLPSR